MKKLIVLLSGLIIAAGAAAQTEKAPVKADPDKRENPAAEAPESANSVSPDFQGSSKAESTASGMGQPKKDTKPAPTSRETGSSAQDAEDKTKK